MSSPFGYVASRIESFGYAARGLVALVATQANARIHLAATVAVVAAGFALDVSASDWRWLVAAICAGWAAEAGNTAVESLADAVHPQSHPLVGRAKDCAAGAVLVTAIGAAITGGLVLGPHLVARIAS